MARLALIILTAASTYQTDTLGHICIPLLGVTKASWCTFLMLSRDSAGVLYTLFVYCFLSIEIISILGWVVG